MNTKLLNDIDKLNDMLDGDYMLIDYMDGYVIHTVEIGGRNSDTELFSIWMNDEESTVDREYLERCILHKMVGDSLI